MSRDAEPEATASRSAGRAGVQPPVDARRRKAGRFDAVRGRIASLVWLVAVAAALVLALGALSVALKLNPDNTLVAAVRDLSGHLDFGVFKKFPGSGTEGSDAATKAALVNWGLAAVIWLVVGKTLDKLVRA